MLVGTYVGCVDTTALLEKQGIVRKKYALLEEFF